MAVMEREAWTDERLDDLAAGIDKRFDRVDADIRELRADMNKGFARIDKRFESMDAKFDVMQRNMITWFIALTSSIVVLAAAVIGASSFS